MGERTPIALIIAASARLAVGEAITNIAAAAIAVFLKFVVSKLDGCRLSGEDANLYDAVKQLVWNYVPR
jgi:phosphoribosylformylglycinamidine synthase